MNKTELIDFIQWYAGSTINKTMMAPDKVAQLYIDKVLGIECKPKNNGIETKH